MNIMEHTILEKITKRGGNGVFGSVATASLGKICETDEVLYRRNGSFTIAIIRAMNGEVLAVGVSKKHPNDRDKPGTAQQIAFARAVRDGGD